MAISNDREMLLVSATEKKYAIEFQYLTEISFDVHVSKIPCLPDCFMGLCNYKGAIIPIVRLDENAPAASRPVILIITCQKYQFGILAGSEPDLIPAASAERIGESNGGADDAGLWKEKELYQYQGELISVIDIERTTEELIVFK